VNQKGLRPILPAELPIPAWQTAGTITRAGEQEDGYVEGSVSIAFDGSPVFGNAHRLTQRFPSDSMETE